MNLKRNLLLTIVITTAYVGNVFPQNPPFPCPTTPCGPPPPPGLFIDNIWFAIIFGSVGLFLGISIKLKRLKT